MAEGASSNPWGRDAAAAFGAANLLYLDVWAELLHPFHLFFRKTPPPAMAYVAVMALILFAAVLAFSFLRLSPRPGALGRTAQAGFLLLWAFGVFFVAHQVALRVFSRMGWDLSNAVLRTTLLLAFVAAAVLWATRRARIAFVLALVAFPVFLVAVLQAGLHIVRPRPASDLAPNQPLPLLPVAAEAPRLVVLLFDEADFRMVFAERPASVAMPEFDRLRAESLFATNATETAGFTYKAVPSLLTGRVAREAASAGLHDMTLSLADGGSATLRPDLMKKLRDGGHNPAVSGWYLPYCRMLDAFTACAWEPADFRDDSGMTLSDWVVKHVQTTVYYLPFTDLLRIGPLISTAGSDRLARTKHLRAYRSLLEEAKRGAAEPQVDFLWVHLPVPHSPGIYDRRPGEPSTEAGRNYLDNLALADRALGEVRKALEDSGTWERTTLMVTSDHGWKWDYWRTQPGWTAEEENTARQMDTRVPLLIRLPGQSATQYDRSFNTVLLHELTLALMSRELTCYEGVVAWLDERRSSVPVSHEPGRR